jgi:two-component system, response regulator
MSTKTILLAEDNASDVELTRRALRMANVSEEVVVASDGQEALDYLFGTGPYAGRNIAEVPAITFLDLKLPKVLGLEVLRRIRAENCTRRMPVVVLTSSKQEHDTSFGYDFGANSYIRKPIDFKKFADIIEHLAYYWLEMNIQPPNVC